MLKKFLNLVLILTIMSIAGVNAQNAKNLVPNYLRADFFEKFPEFYKFKLGQKVKYYPPDKEILQQKPTQLKFLSSDGIESVNISGAIWTDAQTETWIAMDYNDPKNIIATSNDNAYLGGLDGWRMSSFVTTDGGSTWFHSPTPRNYGQYITPYQNRATIFDPAITFDTQGNAYYAYGYTETVYDDNDKNKNGVFVVKSTDKGKSWDAFEYGSDNGIVAITTDAFVTSGMPFHDRYTITSDRSESSPYKDYLYITWRAFGGSRDGIVISYSVDGGESWTDYQRIASGGQGPMPITGPNGELYVAWTAADFGGQTRAMVAKSVNGGATFSLTIESQRVYNIGTYDATNGRTTLTDKQNIRVSSTPQIAVDNSNSQYRGSVYVVQAGRESAGGKYGLYLSTSRTGGSSWTKNKRIDDNSLRNDIFMPSITVDPVTGWIGVFYYSSQNDPENVGLDGYFAFSKDGGTTWKNIRVTPETKYLDRSNTVMPQGLAGGVYWGDYTSVTAYNGSFYPLYWMPTIGNTYTSIDLFTANISQNPAPPKDLAATTDFEPNFGLKLNWTHPTKNLLGEDLGKFKIVVYKGDNIIGEIANTQSPEIIDADVTLGNTYSYRLQTVTDEGLKSSFAEITALVGGDPKPAIPTELSWKPAEGGIMLTWRNPATNIENQPFRDKLKIKVTNLDSKMEIETIDNPQIAAGELSSYLIKEPIKRFYRISIQAVGVRGTTETESDPTAEIIAYSGAPLTEIQENFDGQTVVPNYYTGEWQLTDEKAESAPNSLTDGPEGDYDVNTNTYFMMAPVVLQSGKSTFSFDHIALLNTFSSSGTTDIGEIAYSDDFGNTWKVLKWVDVKTSSNFISGDLANSKFDKLAFNMADRVGDTILFRFRIQTNGLRNDEGWFIDNIVMDDRPSSVADYIEDMVIANVSPNPSTGLSKLNVQLASDANLSYSIYNSLGELIYTYDNKFTNNGSYSFNLDLNNQPNGVYYLRLNINNSVRSLPISIVK